MNCEQTHSGLTEMPWAQLDYGRARHAQETPKSQHNEAQITLNFSCTCSCLTVETHLFEYVIHFVFSLLAQIQVQCFCISSFRNLLLCICSVLCIFMHNCDFVCHNSEFFFVILNLYLTVLFSFLAIVRKKSKLWDVKIETQFSEDKPELWDDISQ